MAYSKVLQYAGVKKFVLYYVLYADPVLAFSELHGTKSFIHRCVKFVLGRFCDLVLVLPLAHRSFHSSERVSSLHELHGANQLFQLIGITVSKHKMYSWFKVS